MKTKLTIVLALLALLLGACTSEQTSYYSADYTPQNKGDLRYEMELGLYERGDSMFVQMALHEFYRKRFLGSYLTDTAVVTKNPDGTLSAQLYVQTVQMDKDKETIFVKPLELLLQPGEDKTLVLKDMKSDLFKAQDLAANLIEDEGFCLAKRPQIVGALPYFEIYGPVKSMKRYNDEFQFDSLGRVTNSSLKEEQYLYDSLGRLEKDIMHESTTHKLFYNSRNQLVKIVEEDPWSNKETLIGYDYKGDASVFYRTWFDNGKVEASDTETITTIEDTDDYGNWTTRTGKLSFDRKNYIMNYQHSVTYY